MNGREINLLFFCGGKEPICKSPWSLGDYSYATDGRILIRVDRRADVPEKGVFAMVEDSITHMITPTDDPWLDCPQAPASMPRPCPYCWEAPEHKTCDECGGSRQVAVWPPVAVGGVKIEGKYIDLISNLDNAMLQVARSEEALGMVPVVFMFAGGCGAVMPQLYDIEREVAA